MAGGTVKGWITKENLALIAEHPGDIDALKKV
jgi:hypothetical protein